MEIKSPEITSCRGWYILQFRENLQDHSGFMVISKGVHKTDNRVSTFMIEKGSNIPKIKEIIIAIMLKPEM